VKQSEAERNQLGRGAAIRFLASNSLATNFLAGPGTLPGARNCAILAAQYDSNLGLIALRRGYHHGNLREALIEAALSLIAEKGSGGLTFADAARAAGVSPAAPYRHFRDREALLAEVAQRGFQLFGETLAKAAADGSPEPLKALDRVGKAYLRFAREEPAYYAAMFESGVAIGSNPELRAAAEAAFAAVRSAVEAVIATLPAASRPPALMMTLHIWSQAHGIASLFGRADGARRPIPMSPEELLEAAVLIYLRGLGTAQS
jgi:AcrR family transcriptional regulator